MFRLMTVSFSVWCEVRNWVLFFFFNIWLSGCFSTMCWKDFCFPTCMFLEIFMGLFLDSILFHWSFCLSLPEYYTVLTSVNLKIDNVSLLVLLIFSKIILAILGSLFLYKLRHWKSVYTKERVLGTWLGGTECADQLGQNQCENIWSMKMVVRNCAGSEIFPHVQADKLAC